MPPRSLNALARRAARIEPFQVMELVKRAYALEAAGNSIIHMNIGEPDFKAPQSVVDALASALARGQSQYTPALGILPLREAIAQFYQDRYGVHVSARRIVITAGASAALLLAIAALVDPGDAVLMPDPCYPCNRNFVRAFDGLPREIPCSALDRFQLSAKAVEASWDAATRGVLVATPSNPTGTSIDHAELGRIIEAIRARGGFTIVDEIYLALSYGSSSKTALEHAGQSDDLFVINSFSKYFGMTGWRLGWLVIPEALEATFEKLSQNLYICASAPAQYAALACFTPETLAIYERRRKEFMARRDFLVPALRALGFNIPVDPDGAFYVYADCSKFSDDSSQFASEMLEQCGVSVIPGADFGSFQAHRWLRISYATSLDQLETAVSRLGPWLAKRGGARPS